MAFPGYVVGAHEGFPEVYCACCAYYRDDYAEGEEDGDGDALADWHVEGQYDGEWK